VLGQELCLDILERELLVYFLESHEYPLGFDADKSSFLVSSDAIHPLGLDSVSLQAGPGGQTHETLLGFGLMLALGCQSASICRS
jgi:hypothetical protein